VSASLKIEKRENDLLKPTTTQKTSSERGGSKAKVVATLQGTKKEKEESARF
jgi:hypothetical protein